MNKTDNQLDNKPDPRACPQCHRFPCGCPAVGGGSGASDQEDTSREKTPVIEDKSSGAFVESIHEFYATDDVSVFLQRSDSEMQWLSASSPKTVQSVDEELDKQDSHLARCRLFATPATDVIPMNASGGLRLDSASASNCVPGMKMGCLDK